MGECGRRKAVSLLSSRPMATILSGGTLMSMDAADAILAADLKLDGNRIAAIGPGLARDPGDTVIDCRDTLIAPGFINVHTHAATAFFRGLADDRPRAFWAGSYAVPGQERF